MKTVMCLLITSLLWTAETWGFPDDRIEFREQEQIWRILTVTDGADFSNETNSLKVYQAAYQKLADLQVRDANRETLLQARTVVAVLGQQWDAFETLAKEFPEQDRWTWHIKTWRLQMRVARKEWQPLANDVTEFANSLSRQPLNLADTSQPTSQAAYSLLKLRIALLWQEGEELPEEFQTIVDRVTQLKTSYAEAQKDYFKAQYPVSPFAYSWLSDHLRFPESKSLKRDQLATMIANQMTVVREAEVRSRKATREYADWQASRGKKSVEGDPEARHFRKRRQLGNEMVKLSLFKMLERTADDPLSVALRSGLWAWQRDQVQAARRVASELESRLSRVVREGGR